MNPEDPLALALSDAPYVDKRHGFQMHYPKTWFAGEGQEKAGNVAVFAPSPNIWEITEQVHVLLCSASFSSGKNISLTSMWCYYFWLIFSVKRVRSTLTWWIWR
jgi:hypothetical protein